MRRKIDVCVCQLSGQDVLSGSFILRNDKTAVRLTYFMEQDFIEKGDRVNWGVLGSRYVLLHKGRGNLGPETL